MKTICFCFEIHQPFRLKRYRFFDIGADSYYYDDYNNENIISKVARESYIPALQTLKEMIDVSEGKFKAALSISGTALDQFEIYLPEFLDQVRSLVKTGNIELISETYSHSLACLCEDNDEFIKQVKAHAKKVEALFGVKPKIFRNTELIYSDEIGAIIGNLGFKGMLIEGAKNIFGWKSPNYIYNARMNPGLKLLPRNTRLSEDLANHFSDYNWSNYPLTADKYLDWIASTPNEEKIFNLFMNFDTFGSLHRDHSGIFDFLKALPRLAETYQIAFETPSAILAKHKPIDFIDAPYPFSWAAEDKATATWLGNKLQKEAFNHLNKHSERIHLVTNRRILQDWVYLQSSDHFYYMNARSAFSPYDSQFDAFTNYMNVLSDFIRRVNEQFPSDVENEELNSLLTTIHNQADEIEALKLQLGRKTEPDKKEEISIQKETKKPLSSAKSKSTTERKSAPKKRTTK